MVNIKSCWDIESFFAWWKHYFKVYHLFAKSENSMMIQILSALITYLLLAIYCQEGHGKHVSVRLYDSYKIRFVMKPCNKQQQCKNKNESAGQNTENTKKNAYATFSPNTTDKYSEFCN